MLYYEKIHPSFKMLKKKVLSTVSFAEIDRLFFGLPLQFSILLSTLLQAKCRKLAGAW
jgi:hypothetical protein